MAWMACAMRSPTSCRLLACIGRLLRDSASHQPENDVPRHDFVTLRNVWRGALSRSTRNSRRHGGGPFCVEQQAVRSSVSFFDAVSICQGGCAVNMSEKHQCQPPACHENLVATKDWSGRTQCQAKKTGNNEKTLAKATVGTLIIVLLTGVPLMMSESRTQGASTRAGTPTPTMAIARQRTFSRKNHPNWYQKRRVGPVPACVWPSLSSCFGLCRCPILFFETPSQDGGMIKAVSKGGLKLQDIDAAVATIKMSTIVLALRSRGLHASIVIREIEIQAYQSGRRRDLKLRRSRTLNTLCSHVRRAQFPIRCPLSCIFPGCAHRRRPESTTHGL